MAESTRGDAVYDETRPIRGSLPLVVWVVVIEFLREEDLGPLSRTCTELHEYINKPTNRCRIRELCSENSTNQITAKYERYYEKVLEKLVRWSTSLWNLM